MHLRSSIAALAATTGLALAGISAAAEFDVPAAFPTLQAAVAAAAVSPDQGNFINLSSSPINTSSPVALGNAFNFNRQLVIRPKPGIAGFLRATILSSDPNAPIITMTGASHVTVQDLDVIRGVTNRTNLIETVTSGHVLIQRCRIGCIAPPGAPGASYLFTIYPEGGVIVRNCIFFSTFFGSCDNGIFASLDDASNSVHLYNNVVANYGVYGISIRGSALGGVAVVRNNVVLNQGGVVTQPMAFHSGVTAVPTVASSHNTVFASGAHVQDFDLPTDQDIAGIAVSQALRTLAPGTEAASFTSFTGSAVPGDPNTNYYRPFAAGLLHNVVGKYGVTVGPGSPASQDVAVIDDLEKGFRPGGVPLHTDRGAFQLDPGVAPAGVGPGEAFGKVLRVSPRTNPEAHPVFNFVALAGGRLTLEIYRSDGRRVGSAFREVRAGESGEISFVGRKIQGLLYYRATLIRGEGDPIEVAGKILISF